MTTNQFCDCFETIFDIISAEGRGERLFGKQNIDILLSAIKTGCLPCPKPGIFLEFPLKNRPYLDVIILGWNSELRQQKYYAQENRWHEMPFGAAFRFFADNFNNNFSFGTTWDLSSTPGQLPQPGFYSANLTSDWAVAGTLECLGRRESVPFVLSSLHQAPTGWRKYYLGLMPNRPNAPIRLGWTIPIEQSSIYHQHPDLLKKDFLQVGFNNFDGEMLQEICRSASFCLPMEFQLDLFPDGSYGPCLGVCYLPFFHPTQQNQSNLERPTTKDFFLYLQKLGLADERWELLKQCFVGKTCYSFADEDVVRCYMKCNPNFAKIKWYSCQPALAKTYLEIIPSEY